MTVTVLAHGCWDGLHIGHIRHLQQAKQLGDRLVVGVTANEYVAKGPNRPRYRLQDRIEALKALRFVDEVVAVHAPDPCEMIRTLKPAVYVKGVEYAGKEIPEHAVVAEVGGRLEFVGETLGSSSAAINAEMPAHPFLAGLREDKGYGDSDIVAALEAIRKLHVLVIGDHILDRYIRCKPLGLTSKGAALSVEVEGRDALSRGEAGGAAAIVGHARALSAHVSYHYGPCVVEKTRWYMMAGNQVRVLFAQDVRRATTLTRVQAQERAPDVILAADFGYGAFDPNMAGYDTAVMCQSNSQNFGTNVLTRRYRRAGLFVLDDRELRLAAHTNTPTRESLLGVALGLGSERCYWTRGQESTTSLCEGEFQECPALEDRPIDPLGAGDAFFAVASLCWAAKVPADLSLLLAQIAGAQLTRVLGNGRSLDREALARTAKAILA